jgi:hypothetical protein
MLMVMGCRPPDRTAPAATNPAPNSTAREPLSPPLAAFRDQLRHADAAAWRRLDFNYLQMQAALGQVQIRDLEYPDYVRQLASDDPDQRANGMCGLAAARSAAAIDHLARALRDERDPYNRTIAVWCLRHRAGDRRVVDALTKYLATCRDIDLGRCIAADGQVRDFQSPFPLAGFEAFKGLVELRGKADMLSGAGWDEFVRRLGTHIQPEPLTALNAARLERGPQPGRTDPDANVRKWLDEMRE